MRVLMFGWEFPPMSSGGLGTACYGLTKGLSSLGVQVAFVMPHGPEDAYAQYVHLIPASKALRTIRLSSGLRPYLSVSRPFYRTRGQARLAVLYGDDLFHEVQRLAELARGIAQEEQFDVIHCHDWMTFPAGMAAKEASGKPLIVHVHATEFDRTGGNNVNQAVYDIERQGMHAADLVIAVSQFTKDKLVAHYGVSPDKIAVVHNAIDPEFIDYGEKKGKMVLFLGRITLQKGPDYFLEAARRCLEVDPDIRFVIAGSGDMEGRLIERAAALGIGDKVLFPGFVTGPDLDRLYQMADLYVMPSVSEPFGITPLEALKNKTPVIVSRTSGVSEVLRHCLKVDFWDTEKLASKILSVLRYREAHHLLKEYGYQEVQGFSWQNPAKKCVEVYKRACHG